MSTALAIRSTLPADAAPEFHPGKLPIFTDIPAHHHGVAVLRGMVVVYHTDTICREGIQEGAFYVREAQHTPARMPWESWLRHEREDEDVHRRAQPRSPLQTSREVVQAIRLRGNWFLRLASGWTDGPYHDWGFGHDFVGKVVGVYAPVRGEVGA